MNAIIATATDLRAVANKMARERTSKRKAAMSVEVIEAAPETAPKAGTKPQKDVDQALVNAVAETSKAAGEAHVALFLAAMSARVQPSQLLAAYAAVSRPLGEVTAKARASAYNSAGKAAKLLGAKCTRQIIMDAAKRPGEVREVVYAALRNAVELAKKASHRGAKAAELERDVKAGLADIAAKAAEAKAKPRAPRMPGESKPSKATGLRALAASHLALLRDMAAELGKASVPQPSLQRVKDAAEGLRDLIDVYEGLAGE